MSIVSLDLETTGLDERIHEAWEVAIVPDDGVELCFQFPMRKHFADTSDEALKIGGWYERFVAVGSQAYEASPYEQRLPPEAATRWIASRTKGATLMGCAISFDMRFLTELMRAYDVEPQWHHRALDLGSWAAGWFGDGEPWSSARMTEIVRNDQAHTALGDARWNWEVYRRIQAGTAPDA